MLIPVYAAEIDAGLAAQVQASASVRLTAEAKQSVVPPNTSVARLPTPAKASTSDFDLYGMRSILVSVGWNKNDDVFDPGELYLARSTPVDKQVNYMHTETDIIGHIIGSQLAEFDGNPIDDGAGVPTAFDVVVASVLYRKWESPELQRRMDDLIKGIAAGEWYVSMECLLRNFDYALRAEDGTMRILARNNDTAFLTKRLRIYGGSGEYNGQKIGRLLRNFTFSGQGVVKTPANERSTILDNDNIKMAASWASGLMRATPAVEPSKPHSPPSKTVASSRADTGAPLIERISLDKPTDGYRVIGDYNIHQFIAERVEEGHKLDSDHIKSAANWIGSLFEKR
jgi:hypothetical protein